MTCTLKASDLDHFTGSQDFFKHPLFRGIVYTEGVQFLGENGCGWLQDMILANLKHNPKLMHQDFVCITLKCDTAKHTAKVYFTDGDTMVEAQILKNSINGKDESDGFLALETVDYTDCMVAEIKFFYTNGTLMLASEY